MGRAYAFEVSSVVPATPAAVWARVSTLAGVNDELMPLVRMTGPQHVALDDPAVPRGRRAFRSWLLLFGVLPCDWDDLTLIDVEPGRGFREASSMLSQRRWEHERRLEAVREGCRVTDRVTFEPRLPVGGPLLRALFQAVFRHRHRRLARHFAAPPG